MQRRYRNDFPPATFAQYVTNPLPQSEASKALTGMFPLAIFHKKERELELAVVGLALQKLL